MSTALGSAYTTYAATRKRSFRLCGDQVGGRGRLFAELL